MESDRTAGPAECEGNQLSSAECLSSAGYTPDNMPVAQAEEHRSKAGQGRQFHCPQSILSDALLWYGRQLGATPGGSSSFVAVRKHRSRASAQAGFIRYGKLGITYVIRSRQLCRDRR